MGSNGPNSSAEKAFQRIITRAGHAPCLTISPKGIKAPGITEGTVVAAGQLCHADCRQSLSGQAVQVTKKVTRAAGIGVETLAYTRPVPLVSASQKRLTNFWPNSKSPWANCRPQPGQQRLGCTAHGLYGGLQHSRSESAPAGMGGCDHITRRTTQQYRKAICRQNRTGNTPAASKDRIGCRRRCSTSGFHNFRAVDLIQPINRRRYRQLILQHRAVGQDRRVIITHMGSEIKAVVWGVYYTRQLALW